MELWLCMSRNYYFIISKAYLAKVSKLINLLELYFDTYFWMDFASVLCTIFEQLLPYGGYLTTETNVE